MSTSAMFKSAKLLTKVGMIAISGILSIVFMLFLWDFLSAESFNWRDFAVFMLIFTDVSVTFLAVLKIFRMINNLGDE
jgi:ABC-type nickel/cobalt efflux system permease component RcnA